MSQNNYTECRLRVFATRKLFYIDKQTTFTILTIAPEFDGTHFFRFPWKLRTKSESEFVHGVRGVIKLKRPLLRVLASSGRSSLRPPPSFSFCSKLANLRTL